MTWKDMLHEHIAGEQNDSDFYKEISLEAQREGFSKESKILKDISKEEEMHKKLLIEMI